MEVQRRLLIVGAVLIAACGGDDTSASGTVDPATESGTSPTTGATDPSAGPGTGDTTGTAGTAGTAGTDSGEDETATAADTTEGSSETDGPAGLEVAVIPSSVAVLEADEMGELTVECLLSDNGVPVVDPGDFVVSLTPNEGFSEAGGVYTFPDTAVFEVTCAIEYDGQMLEATRTIAVLNEAIDPAMAEIGAGMGRSMEGIIGVIAANDQDDQRLFDAVAVLDASLPLLESTRVAELQDVLREMPGGYPTGPEMEAAGFMPSADDAAFGVALDELDAVLGSFEAAMASADPTSMDDAPLTALEGEMAQFEAAVTALSDLSPSAHGLMAQRNRVASLVGERMQPAMHQSAQYLSQRIHAEAGIALGESEGTPFHFGLLGLTLGMFGQSNLRIKLINEWYGDYIAQLDESINNFALAGIIDVSFPVSPEGPVIDFLQASASLGFATPGYPSWIDGSNFDETNGFNLVLVFGDSWQGIIDNIINACGIEESDHPAEAVEKFRDCIDEIEAAVDSLFWYPVSVGPGLFGSPQGLDMGPFPEVCAGGLPTATFVLPMTSLGRGESVFVNCI